MSNKLKKTNILEVYRENYYKNAKMPFIYNLEKDICSKCLAQGFYLFIHWRLYLLAYIISLNTSLFP